MDYIIKAGMKELPKLDIAKEQMFEYNGNRNFERTFIVAVDADVKGGEKHGRDRYIF